MTLWSPGPQTTVEVGSISRFTILFFLVYHHHIIWTQPTYILHLDRVTIGETINDKMIKADQYDWSGERDGAEVCRGVSHQSTSVRGIFISVEGKASTIPG